MRENASLTLIQGSIFKLWECVQSIFRIKLPLEKSFLQKFHKIFSEMLLQSLIFKQDNLIRIHAALSKKIHIKTLLVVVVVPKRLPGLKGNIGAVDVAGVVVAAKICHNIYVSIYDGYINSAKKPTRSFCSE